MSESIAYRDLKKGQKLQTSQLMPMTGVPTVTSILMESPKQGRGVKSTVLVDTRGTEVGMFDEIGSVYGHEVINAWCDDTKTWLEVTDKPKEVNW